MTYSNLAVSPAAAGAVAAPQAVPGAPGAPGKIDFDDVLTRLTTADNPAPGLKGWLIKTMAREAATVAPAAILDGIAAGGPVETAVGVPVRPGAPAKPLMLSPDPSSVTSEDVPLGNPVVVDMTGLLPGASIVRLWTPAPEATAGQSPANRPTASGPQRGSATPLTATQLLEVSAAGVPVAPAGEMPEVAEPATAAAAPGAEGAPSWLSRELKALTSEGTLPVAPSSPPGALASSSAAGSASAAPRTAGPLPETTTSRIGSGMPVPVAAPLPDGTPVQTGAPVLVMSSAPGRPGSIDPAATVPASRLPIVPRLQSPGVSGPMEQAAAANAAPAADPSSIGLPLMSAGGASPDDAGDAGQQPSHHARATMAQHEIAAFQVAVAPAAPSAGPMTIGGDAASATAAAANGAAVVPQIVQAMKLQWSGGIGEAHIRLQPAYLGGLTISIRVDGGVVSATIASDVPAVREWLQGHEALLRQGLTDQGLQLDRLVVAGEARHADRDHGEKPRQDRQPPSDQQASEQKQAPPRQTPDEETFEVTT